MSKVTQCMALCEIFDRDPLLLPPEFFTAPCKIRWDWINLERCNSQKLNMADRVIERVPKYQVFLQKKSENVFFQKCFPSKKISSENVFLQKCQQKKTYFPESRTVQLSKEIYTKGLSGQLWQIHILQIRWLSSGWFDHQHHDGDITNLLLEFKKIYGD